MEVLSSRVIIRPSDPARSTAFYRDTLGLAIYRTFPGGTVFFAGQGLIEVSGHGDGGPAPGLVLWLQVRDVRQTVAELAGRGVPVDREPRQEPWGLHEAWISDPDGIRIVLVEVPADHPIRTDIRSDGGDGT